MAEKFHTNDGKCAAPRQEYVTVYEVLLKVANTEGLFYPFHPAAADSDPNRIFTVVGAKSLWGVYAKI